MKSKLATELKILLDNMSQEEFDKEWEEVVKLKFPADFNEVLKNIEKGNK